MVRGRKGFDRIVWAFENIFSRHRTTIRSSATHQDCRAGQPICDRCPSPPFPAAISENEDQEALELLEWMRLVSLSSPRVRAGDAPEPVLYRYGIPQFSDTTANDGAEQDTSKNLVRLRWHGLIPAQFASGVLSAAVQTTGDEWCAMTAQAFDGKSYTILKNGGNAMTWECE
ncbi:hypothetical protein H2203_002922 [Taxawa tesnikishii (nom. ined.)]|nr:hypothetical protein H2203_002922 [Dothideales sp. JES 119]